MPATHTADFQTAAVKATNLDAVEKINVGIETDKVRKHLNIVADAPEIRIQDKTGSAPEVNATTMAIVADGGATHFRAGTTTFAEGAETKGNVKFQSSTGATTHAEIVGSSGKLELQDGGLGLKRGSNVSVSGTSGVIQEITGPHARDSAVLKKYPRMDIDISNGKGIYDSPAVKGGYVITASNFGANGREAVRAFDGDNSSRFFGTIDRNSTLQGTSPNQYYITAQSGDKKITDANSTIHYGNWLTLGLPSKLKVSSIKIRSTGNSNNIKRRWRGGKLFGSNEHSPTSKSISGNYYQLGSSLTSTGNSIDELTFTINATTAYKYITLLTDSLWHDPNDTDSAGFFYIHNYEIYGYEDVGAGDDSVDTTVKSVYNAPDLTSAALYIDATKPDSNESVTDQSGSGVTVTATGVTHDSTENAWELTGAATSNIVSGNLASLVGDHPHSVSAWVKADQLNGSGLFHVGTAEGEGDAASRVGFVDDSHISWGGEDHYFSSAEWHNVTYTYNGEGSGKKLFLDGRLVGSAKNEDTFGEYPPFAMSNYSQYGYTVSASSEYPGTDYLAHEAFNKTHADNGDCWLSADATYDGSTGNYNGSANLGSDSGGTAFANADKGEWLKMEMPHKLVLEYIDIVGSTASGVNPKDWKIYGSNDDKNWDVLLSKTNTVTAAYNDTVNRIHTVSATRAYKYLALVVTKSGGLGSGTHYTQVGELRFFGHRENDLVRFPDSVNTLKYPHVAMTGPAQRGYVATASSYRTVGPGDYRPHRAFNKVFNAGSNQGWNNQNTLTEYNGTDYLYNGSINLGTGAQNGEWIKLELPRKILMTSMTLYSRDNDPTRAPEDFIVYGSNDDSNWSELLSEVGATPADTGTTYTADTATTYYKYFALVVRRITGQNNYFSIDNIEYIGTEEDLDVVARVGDGFDGKIRNLRVYSTALSDARVQEIFDADKDEFGLAKSSVSVYRGHLGVGTTEPKAALTVMDEVAELEEFPPRRLTSEETYLEGHGVFKASASYTLPDPNHPSAPWKVFSKDIEANATGWLASDDHNAVNGSNPGEYNGTNQLAGSIPLGEWLKIELPHKIKLNKYALKPWGINNRYGVADYPKTFYIYGSNDGSSWELVDSRVNTSDTPEILGATTSSNETIYYNVTQNGLSYYDRYAIVITKINSESVYAVDNTISATYVALGEWRLFGTREQGASTLHNGELSLTRNLTVPRIGPPLDADDTPRRDRLVVEYNTSTNPTENGLVKDTSGRGLDGRMVGTTYDSTEKWFQCTASDGSQWIDTRIDSGGSRLSEGISGSIWVNQKSFDTSSKNSFIWSVGDRSGTGNNREIAITYNAVGQTLKSYYVSFNGGSGNMNVYHTSQTPFDVWTHVGMTYDGTTVKLYINGVYSVSSTITDVNIPETNCFLRLNGDVVSANSTHQGTPMNLSNFKLYDVALTADEVKRLYDMGRCDEGHHVVNFSKTRVGIGLGDGEVSDALLNVGGVPYGRGAKPCFCASRRAGNVSSGTTIIFDHVEVNQQNGYNSTTGTFTAPVSGLYLFSFYGMSNDSGNAFGIRAYKNGDTHEMFWPYTHHHAGSPHKHVSGTQIVPMNTGDTFLFKVQSGTLYGGSNGHNSFVGYLIE
jgi:hypothetical protein